MKGIVYDLWSRFLTQFSKIKVLTFWFLPILAYDPDPYYVTGDDVVDMLGILRPGDVLVRGYDKYLDGKFIPDERGYSHAGLFIGGHDVIHAVSPSVERINVLDFCQCDRILVLRPDSGQDEAIAKARSLVGVPYDFDYKSDRAKLYCFELIANCYPSARIEEFKVKKFFGLVKRKCYLAKSLYGCEFFKEVFERNAVVVNTP